jgi:transposase-like protein
MRGNRTFSEAFKRQVVREVTSGMLSKAEAKLKYNLKGHSAVLYWIRTFEDRENISKNRKMDYSEKSKEALIKRIKELERQLEDEQIRAEGYSKMIDIAEDQLNISIRKKSTTKQSTR